VKLVGTRDHAPTEVRRSSRLIRIVANVVGAVGAAYFAKASLDFYVDTHRFIGAALFFEQLCVVIAYLCRRPARAITTRTTDWLLAFSGTFGGVLLRPYGAHPHWGVRWGLVVQLVGVLIGVLSYLTLGRSFGFAAANRGLVTRGPYSVVRHPVYASYLLTFSGYLMQSISLRNALVVVFVISCNVGRAIVEERVLATSGEYGAYRQRVRWRLVPGVW
jgi:protein-S-isoprenylcysteine O-methyltransferase Ste14